MVTGTRLKVTLYVRYLSCFLYEVKGHFPTSLLSKSKSTFLTQEEGVQFYLYYYIGAESTHGVLPDVAVQVVISQL